MYERTNNEIWKTTMPMKSNLRYLIMGVLLVLFQVLVLNNIQFSGLINPFVYVLFILILPINIPRYALLLIGFILGISIDVFANTPGIHASATVFISWVRPVVINMLSPRDNTEEELIPGIGKFGFFWFLRYAALMIFVHHFFLFFVEAFTLNNVFQTLLRIGLSTLFSLIAVVLTQLIVFRDR